MAQPMPQQSYMAYDRTIVVFSPDGRLLQVEYAREAVKRGATAVGVKVQGAAVLGAIKVVSRLMAQSSYKKVYEVDGHIGMVSSGLLADASDLVKLARVKAQINKITYGEPISVSSMAKYLASRKHLVTQYAGVRPYGVGLLIGGSDKTGVRLFETDPSGTMIEWDAQAIGKGADKAKKVLERGYRNGMKLGDGVKLVMKALKASDKDVTQQNVEIAVVGEKEFKRLNAEESKRL